MGVRTRHTDDRVDTAITWATAGLTLVVLLTTLPIPYTGDQALFALGGDALLRGDALYVDFWDLKQPGVFWFFGASEAAHIPPHVLEVVWASSLAVLAVHVARVSCTRRWLAPIAALTTVAWPYAVAGPDVLTQVELLVGLPTLAALVTARSALTAESSVRADVAAVLCGLAVVAVAMLKLMLLGTLAAALVALVWALPVEQRFRLPRLLVIAGVTATAISAVVVVALAAQGALGDALRTWFVVPLGAGSRAGRSVSRLVDSARVFVRLFAPMLALGSLGALRAWRRRDSFGLASIAWLLAGAVTNVAQLGWYYLMSLLVVPLGLLAISGIDEVFDLARGRRRTLVVWTSVLLLAVLSLPAASTFVDRLDRLVDANGALEVDDRRAFQSAEYPTWSERAEQADALNAAIGPGDTVVVWGDPLILEIAGARQAIAMSGWSPEHLDDTLWRRAGDEMRAAMPDLVLVDPFSARMIDERGDAVGAVLADDYELWRDHLGLQWYVPREQAATATSSGDG